MTSSTRTFSQASRSIPVVRLERDETGRLVPASSTVQRSASTLLAPVVWVGRRLLASVSYLGGLATLSASSTRSLIRPEEDAPARVRSLVRELAALLALGFPLVALVHVGLGSFLSMQAYFGGTFVDGTGAVVGVGLIRNLASQMVGFILAGLVASRTTTSLIRSRSSQPVGGPESDPPASAGRAAAIPIAATVLAGPILSLWGVVVGTVVGWQVSQTLLGVSTDSFLFMFEQMIWLRDVVGLVVKGMAYGYFAGLFACYEGLRTPSGSAPPALESSACRAACGAMVAILILNSGWFLLVYHAGPAFGPTLLAPPIF
jgi:phospholipid/cholesterol/gamma-HCH transport system permease protein